MINLILKQNNKEGKTETVLSGADTKQKTTTHKTQTKKDKLYDQYSLTPQLFVSVATPVEESDELVIVGYECPAHSMPF